MPRDNSEWLGVPGALSEVDLAVMDFMDAYLRSDGKGAQVADFAARGRTPQEAADIANLCRLFVEVAGSTTGTPPPS